MAIKPTLPLANLLGGARGVLSLTQAEFGRALGVSHRTAVRWDAGESYPGEASFHALARLLAPVDRALASEAAAFTGDTLESLGLAPPPPPAPPPKPPRAPVSAEDLADIVVCAVAEVADSTPRALRPLLHVAFKRAREVGLTVEEVERALSPRAEAVSAGEKPARKGSAKTAT